MFELLQAKFSGLVEGKDYEVLTFKVMNGNFDEVAFGRYYKKDVLKLVGDKPIQELVKEHKTSREVSILPTKPLVDNATVYLLEVNKTLNIDNAIDCGFGVIKMLTGEFEGNYFLYNSDIDEQNLPIMLDVYLQLSVKDYNNTSLKAMISTKLGRDMLRAIQSTDDTDLYTRLLNSFGGQILH
jgi:hypothetical protein